jgi:trehalose 6-phosphate phosphatase
MSFVRAAPHQFELLAARQAFEVRPKGITKARAVQMLIETEPFRARQPVFVGDDATDEDGMEIAARLGGFGLNVGAVFGGKPPAVRDWLSRAADALT